MPWDEQVPPRMADPPCDPGTVVASLGGRDLLFHEAGQALYELSGSPADAARGQVTAPRPASFAPAPAPAPRIAPSGLEAMDLDVGGIAVRVELDHSLLQLADSLFGHLRANGHPAIRLAAWTSGDGVALTGPDGSVRDCPREHFVPVLKALVIEAILGSASCLVALHAAALIAPWREDMLLLVGSPGAGKSTLGFALASAGFALAADDVTLLESDGRAVGLPFPLTAKASAWDLLAPDWPDLSAAPCHLRPDGQAVRYLLPPRRAPAGPLRVGCVALLDRAGSADATLQRIDPVTALEALIAEAASPDERLSGDGFLALVAMLDGARCVRLSYGEARDAAAALAAELA